MKYKELIQEVFGKNSITVAANSINISQQVMYRAVAKNKPRREHIIAIEVYLYEQSSQIQEWVHQLNRKILGYEDALTIKELITEIWGERGVKAASDDIEHTGGYITFTKRVNADKALITDITAIKQYLFRKKNDIPILIQKINSTKWDYSKYNRTKYCLKGLRKGNK